MVLSLGVIVVLMFAVVGPTGLCTINPEDSQQGRVHEVDAATFLDMEARSSGVAVRMPDLPEGWYTNSARREALGGENGATVGFVSPDEGYIASTQTNLSLEDAVKNFDGHFRAEERTGTIDGVDYIVKISDDRDVRDLWAADLGDVRLLLSGTAATEEYETLLKAFIDAEPIEHAQDADGAEGQDAGGAEEEGTSQQ